MTEIKSQATESQPQDFVKAKSNGQEDVPIFFEK